MSLSQFTPEELLNELEQRGMIEKVRIDYQATKAFKGLLDDPEELCPTCGNDEHDDHVESCARIDTCGQFGPPWLSPPWHPQPDLFKRGEGESRVAFDVRAAEWSRSISEHARTHALIPLSASKPEREGDG